MCTAISFLTNKHYFGRNLDLEGSFEESVTITPRNYPFFFRHQKPMTTHYAMIGTAYICDHYPLYYDATNEKGLSMAGLNFPGYAKYKAFEKSKDNIPPFELIPWVLGQCSSTSEAKNLLQSTNLLDENFKETLPSSPLHWIISDAMHSITVEPLKNGVKLYENPIGVLTNSPTFDMQLFHLNQYMNLTPYEIPNTFAPGLDLTRYSRGMGAIGLPGDWSSQSRFVKAAFVSLNSSCKQSEEESVSQFFHILSSVEHPRGSVIIGNRLSEITIYSSCCNTQQGIYYYKTYDNHQITAVSMHQENLNSDTLISYPFRKEFHLFYENQNSR